MRSGKDRYQSRLKRKSRIRKRLVGTTDRPRLCVFRSAQHIYAQIVDDTNGSTLSFAASVESMAKAQPAFESKVAQANYIGKLIGERALEKGIKRVVFDRNGFLYHGRIKALSEGAREAGLDF